MRNLRLIARLDIKGPNLIKGIHLEGLRVLGSPNEFALDYYKQGIDELIYMDCVASLYGRKKAYTSKTYELTHIVDRVGSGDAFAGGLIYGLLHLSPKEAIEFAMAAGVLKHSVPGDILYCSLQEIQELVAGEGNGKIKR